MGDGSQWQRFVGELTGLRSDEAARSMQRYFKTGPGEYGEGDVFLGIPVPAILTVAKPYLGLPPDAIEHLLDNGFHEVRTGACAIMAKQASLRRTPDERRRELFDLYLRRHDCINNWDLVDRAAPDVVGRYLERFPDDTLERLAGSRTLWERRTAIVATLAHIRAGDGDTTFRIAELLVDDTADLIHKAVGWLLREAGKPDPGKLLVFLDEHAGTMPRTMLRSALERLAPDVRTRYLGQSRSG